MKTQSGNGFSKVCAELKELDKEFVEFDGIRMKPSQCYTVSLIATAFIGQAECLDETKPPLLFETMIRGGINDGIVQQYTSWEQAEEGHAKAVQLASTE